MSRVWLPVLIVTILIFGNIPLDDFNEETSELNNIIDSNEVIEYGLNNSQEFIFANQYVNWDLKITAMAVDPLNLGYFIAGHVFNDGVITVNNTNIAIEECDLFIAKANLDDEIVWFTTISNQTGSSIGSCIFNQNGNTGMSLNNLEFVTEILVSNLGDVFVFGGMCHAGEYQHICYTFNEEHRGAKAFVAKYNYSTGLQEFNSTFLYDWSSSSPPPNSRDRLKMSSNVGFLKNQTSIIFGIQHASNWGITSMTIDGKTCGIGQNQHCGWILEMDFNGYIINSYFEHTAPTASTGTSCDGLDDNVLNLETNQDQEVLFSLNKNCNSYLTSWNVTSNMTTNYEKANFVGDFATGNVCNVGHCTRILKKLHGDYYGLTILVFEFSTLIQIIQL